MQWGEIYLVSFDPVQGREQFGTRPALVVSCSWINNRPLVVIVVPGTDGANIRKDFPTNVRVPSDESGLHYETVFLCFQARALDPGHFPANAIGQLTAAGMQDIDNALRFCLDL